jgi:tRNA 2-selenouridine synthase
VYKELSFIKPQELYPAQSGQPTGQLLDVRAPIEVERGAMPYSIFEPILTNEERHQVGICYKEKGQQAAIDLGYALTEPYLESRIVSWKKICEASPTAVACWRGGLRSKLTTEFIGRSDVLRIEGGYKALRNYVMGRLEPVVNKKQIVVLTGLTGSGKTELLRDQVSGFRGQKKPFDRNPKPETRNLEILDLEAEAQHRGSAFGKLGTQPSQATFENHLATKLLLSPHKTILLEDESKSIGRVWIPDVLFTAMCNAPIIVLDISLEERIQNIFEEYVKEATLSYGLEAIKQKLETNLLRLYQKLGWNTTSACVDSLHRAEDNWLEPSAHCHWIKTLLTQYYDPLYKKSLLRYERPVLFQGSREECLGFIEKQ